MAGAPAVKIPGLPFHLGTGMPLAKQNHMKKLWIPLILVTLFLAAPAGAAVEGVFPTAQEALFLEFLNEARANPSEAALSVGAEPVIPVAEVEDPQGGEGEEPSPARLNAFLTVSAEELAGAFISENGQDGTRDREERLLSILDRWGYLAKRTGVLTGIVGFLNYLDPDEAVRILFRTMLTRDLKGEDAKGILLDPAFREVGVCFDGAMVSYGGRVLNAYFVVFTAAEEEKAGLEALQLGQLVNQARVRPDDTARAMGLPARLPEAEESVEAMPPLRWNRCLLAAVQGHAADMLDRGFCDTVNPDGKTAADRAVDTGFEGEIAGEWVGSAGLCGCDELGDRVARLFRRAFHSEWLGPAGDRKVLNPAGSVFAVAFVSGYSETLGGICGPDVGIWAADFGRLEKGEEETEETTGVEKTHHVLSGVLYEDHDGDGLYGLGEGLESIDVTVTGLSGTLTAVTDAAGGFAVPLPAGEYKISASPPEGSGATVVAVIGEGDGYVALPAGGPAL